MNNVSLKENTLTAEQIIIIEEIMLDIIENNFNSIERACKDFLQVRKISLKDQLSHEIADFLNGRYAILKRDEEDE